MTDRFRRAHDPQPSPRSLPNRARVALAGAVASVALSILPFSPALGGALAGFLAGADRREGLLVGALSGFVLFVPAALLCLVVAWLLVAALGVVAVPGAGIVAFAVFVGVLLSLVFCYTVILSALGGLCGAEAAARYPARSASVARRLGLVPSSSDLASTRPSERAEATRDRR